MGEFLILVGTFRVNVLYAVLGTAGIILAAVYMLWMFQRVMFGPVTHDANRGLRDLSPREVAVLVPVLVLIVWIGVYPQPFLRTTEASVRQLLAQVHLGKAPSAEHRAPNVVSSRKDTAEAQGRRGAGGRQGLDEPRHPADRVPGRHEPRITSLAPAIDIGRTGSAITSTRGGHRDD